MEYNRLQIKFEPSIDTFNSITTLLGVSPEDIEFANFPNGITTSWTYELPEPTGDIYFDFINRFLDLLDSKYEELARLNVQRDDISIWHLYEYESQCNMEFDPSRLKRLGDNGITLCISCWKKNDVIDL